MCDIPTFDPYVKLMEEWRDFQWRKYLLMSKNEYNTSWREKYWNRAHNLDFAMRIINEQAPVPKDERLDEFKHLKYGQYPDNWNVPEMD